MLRATHAVTDVRTHPAPEPPPESNLDPHAIDEFDELDELDEKLHASADIDQGDLTAIRHAVESMSSQMTDLKRCLLLMIASRDYYGWSKWDTTEKEQLIVQNDASNKDTYGVEPEEMMHMRWIRRARDILRSEWPDCDPREPPKRPDQH